MSEPSASPVPEIGPDYLDSSTGGFYTLSLYNDGTQISQADGLSGALTSIDRLESDADKFLSAADAQANRAMWTVVKGGLSDGVLTPAEVPGFFHWLWQSQGVTTITGAMVAAGTFGGLLLRYAQAHGYRPPVPAPLPALPDLSPLTLGQQALVAGASALVPQHVSAPGLTKPETLAIQKAIGVASAGMLRVMARTFDLYLPGMHPGQVPTALDDLFTAAATLERQVHALQASSAKLGTTATKGELATIKAEIAALSVQLTALQADIVKASDQLAMTKPSELGTHLGKLTGEVAAIGLFVDRLSGIKPSEIERIGKELESVSSHLSTVEGQVDKDLGVSGRLQSIERETEDNARCCAAVTSALEDAMAAIGGKSALSLLGSLALKAGGILAAIGLAETVITIIDAPLAASAMMSDVETIASFAEATAVAMIGVIPQIGPLGG